ncbi:faxdc2 [Pungitius sinensis]
MTPESRTGDLRGVASASRQEEAPGGLWDSVKKAAVVIGSGILLLAAFGNSLTWHLQRFWGASGDFWQDLWTKLHVTFEGHHTALFYLGTMLVPTLAFSGANALLLLVDTTGKPAFITRYRIQVDKNNPVEKQKLIHALKTVLFNHLCISGPMLVGAYQLMTLRGDPCDPQLPTFHRALMELAFFSILEELVFYYSHRLFHQPGLYKRFPQAAPRVDGPHRHRVHLRSPPGAHYLQHAAGDPGPRGPGLPPDHHLPVAVHGPHQHHHLALRVPPPLPALPRVPRLPPPAVQPVLRGFRGSGPAPRHRRQVPPDEAVRAPLAADGPHTAEREHPRRAH